MDIRTVGDLIKKLEEFDEKLRIFVSAPVEMDGDNVRFLEEKDIVFEALYPAVVLFEEKTK